MKKTIIVLTVIMLVLSVFALGDGWAPSLPEEEQPPTPPNSGITYDSTLEIIEINIDVDGKEDTITSNNKKISKTAKEESDLKFEIKVKNNFNQTIEDIELTVIIKDIDDGDDLDEESDSFDLEAAKSDSEKVNLDLPLKVDNKKYNVIIKARGRDENSAIHEAEWNLELEVKKDNHKIDITKASLSPSTVSCLRQSNLDVEILNLGREDEDDVKIEVKNQELGIDLKEENIELDEGTDNDAEHSTSFRLNIPENAKEGLYPINIETYYDGKKSSTKNVNLIVGNCGGATKQKESVLIETFTQPIKLTQTKQKTKSSGVIAYILGTNPMIVLTIVLLVVLVAIILLMSLIIIQLKK